MLIDKIICSIDFSEHSRQVAGYAAMMATALKAGLTVLYVAPALEEYAEFQTSPGLLDSLAQKVTAEAEYRMALFVGEHFPGLEAVGRVENGYPAETIISVAVGESAGLIVMGTHGRKGFNRLVFGSVAEKVIKTSPVPVLTIRPAGDGPPSGPAPFDHD